MEHISDIKLLDYVAGKLAGKEIEQVRWHIAECADCASRYQQARLLWHTLGKWQVDPSAHQIAGRVEALAAERQSQHRPVHKVFAAFRIAAAIILAIGGGHLLARFSAPSNEPTAIISTDKPQYLAALGFEWSSELTWTVLQEDVQSGANQP